MEWNSLVGAIVGGLIAGIFSLLAVKSQVNATRKIDKTRSNEEIEGILQALRDEIETIYQGYMQSIGKIVDKLKPKEAFMFHCNVIENYFTIYNSNASMIGKIDDKELRQCIVQTYNKAKMLLDAFQLNNKILIRHEGIFVLSFKKNDPYIMALLEAERKRLVETGSTIKEYHEDAKASVEKFLKCLDRRKSSRSKKILYDISTLLI